MTSSDAAGHVGAVGGRRDRDHPGERRAQTRCPAEREHRAQQRRAADRRQLQRREPGIPLQQRDEADEHQAHQDRDHAADALQQ